MRLSWSSGDGLIELEVTYVAPESGDWDSHRGGWEVRTLQNRHYVAVTIGTSILTDVSALRFGIQISVLDHRFPRRVDGHETSPAKGFRDGVRLWIQTFELLPTICRHLVGFAVSSYHQCIWS